MYVVWLLTGGSGGFTGISWDAKICSGFPPPQAALAVGTSREKGSPLLLGSNQQYGVYLISFSAFASVVEDLDVNIDNLT